jgi:hypothetical protein
LAAAKGPARNRAELDAEYRQIQATTQFEKSDTWMDFSNSIIRGRGAPWGHREIGVVVREFGKNLAEGTQHGHRAGHDPGESLRSRGKAPTGPGGTGRIGPVRGCLVEALFFGRGFAIVVVPAKSFAVAGFHQQVFMGTALDHGLFTAGGFVDKGGVPGCGCLANIDIAISVHYLLLSRFIYT